MQFFSKSFSTIRSCWKVKRRRRAFKTTKWVYLDFGQKFKRIHSKLDRRNEVYSKKRTKRTWGQTQWLQNLVLKGILVCKKWNWKIKDLGRNKWLFTRALQQNQRRRILRICQKYWVVNLWNQMQKRKG